MNSYPEDTDRRQGITKVVEMGIAAVPGVGGPLQIAFQEAAGRRLADRRAQWLNDLAQKAHRLESRIGDFEHLLDQDTFMDAVTTASQIADRTSRAAKLELLRNAVVNSVLPDAPHDDTQQLFFDMLDRFTPTHVRLLTLLSDPPGWFARHDISRPNVTMGGKSVIIEAGMPELASRKDLIDRYAAALSSSGLIAQSLSGVMSAAGLWAAATTPLASEFLAFISDPETDEAG
ncbi:hypothetical protein Ait01nite_091290 [Actinoplanes italicus]|jgi:hypothetical protein|uniref:DUF4393 domain-containing protein n=1 Tax=Actinoplanes italicus TaxID=113567 RepID=A0A2T0JSX1_9ACTN|nr:hypothetical protein [Actinoplanes italicus]PRX10530.1 hypothetical protein CLV67_13310 [Actinoplanes italicus]GIE36084.1 hypothetical protein Ait01nite_091290 [Actinoplanes italicus]